MLVPASLRASIKASDMARGMRAREAHTRAVIACPKMVTIWGSWRGVISGSFLGCVLHEILDEVNSVFEGQKKLDFEKLLAVCNFRPDLYPLN